jgi:GT2 family glycosyltransferase
MTGSNDSNQMSVVLVAYNSRDVIVDALDSVVRVLPMAEIIVVDNGSSDGTAEAVAGLPNVRVVDGGGNVGFGAGVNLGVAEASGEHVLVLNPDASLEEFSLPPEAIGRPRFGLVAASEIRNGAAEPLLLPVLPWPLEIAYALSTWLLVPREMTLKKGRWFGRSERIDGAAFVVRTDEFRALGGMNERLFLYYEDEELTSRYRANGYDVAATGSVLVQHLRGQSSPRLHETVVAWALLSLVELVSIQHGHKRGRLAGGLVKLGLRAILAAGLAVQWLPLLGPRAHAKANSASAILDALKSDSVRHPRAGAYTQAARYL